jgi:uncharacterized iron-regulated membrane protein
VTISAAEQPPAEAMTRTEAAAQAPVTTKGPVRRWLRRRPVRRGMVVTHRWLSLVLGLFLVIETTSGAILLYRAEYFRSTHGDLYQHSASANPITPQQAVDIVTKAHPEFKAAWVSNDGGILAVGDPAFADIYAVDPGTGHINGSANIDSGVMGFLANLHDCGLTCQDDPGYVSWLAKPVPTMGMAWLATVTWGSALLALLGLLMIFLAITGLITWWPGFRRMSRGFRVRAKKGRFARDYDLHNVIGIIAVPMVFLWGVTGTAFELPKVEDAWLAITGGHSADPNRYSFTADAAPSNAVDIGVDGATKAALQRYPGEIHYLQTPRGPGEAAYYAVSVSNGYAPYNYRGFFSGDVMVYVDAHNPAHTSVVGDAAAEPGGNAFYDKVFEPLHFGWLANGWWRIGLFVLGLTPLALMVTGLSTWLFRHSTKKRKRQAAKARAATAASADGDS